MKGYAVNLSILVKHAFYDQSFLIIQNNGTGRIWAERVSTNDKVKLVTQLLERYELEVIPLKSPSTRIGDLKHVKKIRAVFGDMPLQAIKPHHIYQYADKRKKADAAVTGRREIALLSHALTKAVEWGYINTHPFKGQMRLEGEKARVRYVEDWEITEVLSLVHDRASVNSIPLIQAYIRLKLMTGLRKGDMLRLSSDSLKEDGIHVTPQKTKKTTGSKIIFEWNDDLRQAVKDVLDHRPVDIAPWLFCTKRGTPYFDDEKGTTHAFDSIWQRFMGKVLRDTKVTERFTEHDLRAKASSDAKSLDQASATLGHSSTAITRKVYRRKPSKVTPFSPNE